VVLIPHSLVLAFAFIALSGVGAYGPMGAFWAIPTETLSPRIVGSVMGFVNAIGNLGAYFAPLIVGHLNKRTGSFLSGFTYLGVITLVAAGLATLLRTHARASRFKLAGGAMKLQTARLRGTLLPLAVTTSLALGCGFLLAQEPPTPPPPPLPPPQARSHERLAIRAGRMFDPKSGELRKQQVILIEGTRIAQVGPSRRCRFRRAPRRLISATPQYCPD